MTYANEYIGEIEVKNKEDEEKKTKERLEKYKELMDEIKEKEEEEEQWILRRLAKTFLKE